MVRAVSAAMKRAHGTWAPGGLPPDPGLCTQHTGQILVGDGARCRGCATQQRHGAEHDRYHRGRGRRASPQAGKRHGVCAAGGWLTTAQRSRLRRAASRCTRWTPGCRMRGRRTRREVEGEWWRLAAAAVLPRGTGTPRRILPGTENGGGGGPTWAAGRGRGRPGGPYPRERGSPGRLACARRPCGQPRTHFACLVTANDWRAKKIARDLEEHWSSEEEEGGGGGGGEGGEEQETASRPRLKRTQASWSSQKATY